MKSKKELLVAYQKLVQNVQTGMKRGFAFERLFNELLQLEGLHPSFPYKFDGEQIDGMFEFQNRFFYLECKWEAKPLSVSSVYAFEGKLRGKLIGGIGIFVSMSDFSIKVAKSLPRGKDINILLFTREDVDYCFSEKYAFSEILKAKMRHAALYGSVFYEYKTHLKLLKNNRAK